MRAVEVDPGDAAAAGPLFDDRRMLEPGTGNFEMRLIYR